VLYILNISLFSHLITWSLLEHKNFNFLGKFGVEYFILKIDFNLDRGFFENFQFFCLINSLPRSFWEKEPNLESK